MLNSFLPPQVNQLTEATSIALVKQIQSEVIATPLSFQPITTTFVRQGQGDTPILLLHGFDSSLLEFRRLLPLLAKEKETWAIDLLGFGFTERLQNISITPDTIKNHLYAFWKTSINQPVILVGVSMGGATAIDLSISYPEIVQKLILIDSAGLARGREIKSVLLTPLVYLAAEFLRQSKVRDYVSKKAYYDRRFASPDALLCAGLHLSSPRWRQAMVTFTKSGGYNGFSDRLSRVQQPTSILWGDSDEILGTADAEKFQQAIANSQLIWIENCGHVPHLEKPEIAAKHILDFCE